MTQKAEKHPSNSPEVVAERNIEQRREASHFGMDESTAREWARLDVQDFSVIRDDDLARFAATTITGNFQNPAYKAEFELAGPAVMAKVAERTAANEAMVAAKSDRKQRECADMIAATRGRAKRWTPEQAAEQARSDVAGLLVLTGEGVDNKQERATAFSHEDQALRYERDYRMADIAMFAAANPEYLAALEQTAPDVAAQLTSGVTLSDSSKVICGTFVGKITAVGDDRVEQKIGRDPRDVMVHDRSALSGDGVSVGHVVTVSYEKGKGQVRNHDLAVEHGGMGR